jgi:deazaflavin-dependent oxidoreductase (nitroreductase family)
MASTRLNPALRRLFRASVSLYHWNCGWLLGHRFLMVVHVGRRTGKRRYTVLEVMEYRKEGPEMIVMSAFGRNADWFRNIEAGPDPEVAVGSRRFTASWRLLDKEDAIKVIAGYERRNRFAAPIVRAVLSRLLGWRYDGSEGGRSRLAEELPLVAFRPKASR